MLTPPQTEKQPHSPTRRTISFLTQDETRRLFSAITTKRDRAIFLTAYRHSLRASEIGMLHRTDVDLKSGRLAIQRAKGSLSGVYAMQPDEIKTLRAYVATRADSSPYLFISNRTLLISRFTLLKLMQTAPRPPRSRRRSGNFTPSNTRSLLTSSTPAPIFPL